MHIIVQNQVAARTVRLHVTFSFQADFGARLCTRFDFQFQFVAFRSLYDNGTAQQCRVHVDVYRALTVGVAYSPAFVSERVESPFEAAAVAACVSAASAEHLREEVREASSCKLTEVKSFKAACVCTACGTAAHACHFPVFAVLVVFGPFFRLVQYVIRFIQSLEFGFGFRTVGMQVRGVLETRNIDFRNLCMLALTEGQLPKAGGDSSFIPYNLRKAFGMTTIEHKNSVYAYYFYRLIQRAENITLLYNTASDGLNRGEMSRFMLQFLVESPHDISRQYLEAGQSPQQSLKIEIRKTDEVLQRMYKAYDIRRHPNALFSPSALNTYLDCRLRFYYRYVAGLKAPDEVSAEIDSALFGTIFHRSAELVYQALTANGKEIRREDLEQLLRNDVRLQSYVDTAFKEEFFHVPAGEQPEYNGTQLIHSKVIASYLRQLFRNDLQYAPFRMEGMEQKVTETLEIETPSGMLPLNIGGTIDRMDSKGDTLRIVDYKTGGTPKTPESIEQLFTPADNRPNYSFQTFLYAAIMCRKQGLKVAPSLLYIHRAASESYSPVIEMGAPRQPKVPVNNFAFYEDEFRERLSALLKEIYNPEEPFTQTEDAKKCEYCDFKRLCKK